MIISYEIIIQIIIMRKKSVINVVLVMTCSLLILLIVALTIMLLTTFDYKVTTFITVDSEQYHKWENHIELEKKSISSGLYLFPDENSIATDAVDMDYLYYCADINLGDNEYLIYTEADYSKDSYQREKKRLSEVKCEIRLPGKDGNTIKSPMYTEDLFSLPAYVAIYASNYCYEYVLLDEDNYKMIYVYMEYKDGNSTIPSKYLPKAYIGKDIYINNSWDNINIYYAKDKLGTYCFYRD